MPVRGNFHAPMHRKNPESTLHRGWVETALYRIEADLTEAHPRGFETFDRVLSSHPSPELTHVYGLLLKGDTWAEVAERVFRTQSTG
jgi:hypothetical protein